MQKNEPSQKDLEERYNSAMKDRVTWASRLEEMYEYFFPTRARFFNKTRGESKTNKIFDPTGESAAEDFSNFLKEMLMPVGQQWINLDVGPTIKNMDLEDGEINQIKKKLQEDTDILFQYINRSYFDLALIEAFKEVIAGTGAIIIQEGTIDHPIKISSVPMYSLYIGQTSQDILHDFWRVWNIKKRDILINWTQSDISTLSRYNEEDTVNIVEGCVFIPENDPEYQYYYYVQSEEGKKDILYSDFFSQNPFTAFRFDKVPDDTYGRGVLEIALPFVKVLNKMAEYDLQCAARIAYPPYIDLTGRSLNPSTSKLLPNSLISIQWNGSGMPIQPLQSGGNLQYALEKMQDLRNSIREILYSNPIAQIENSPNRTATEIAIRQQSFVEKSSRAIVRLARECVIPIVNKSINILRNKGLLKDITLENGTQLKLSYESHTIDIEYNSPIVKVENQQKVQAFMNWLQITTQVLEVPKIQLLTSVNTPEWIAQNLGVDLSIINDSLQNADVVSSVSNNLMNISKASGANPIDMGQSLGILPSQGGASTPNVQQ